MDRNPVGARFSAPVHTGPGVHPASYTMGSGSFLGVKRPERGVNHPLPSCAEVKEKVELHLCPRLCRLGRLQGELYTNSYLQKHGKKTYEIKLLVLMWEIDLIYL